jgi:hypothetical protein
MRRVVLALAVGGALLAPAACGTAKSPSASDPKDAGPALAATASPETKQLCEALGQVYSKNLGPVAAALSKMVADRKTPAAAKASQEQAQEKLGALATAIRGATEANTDPALRADGKKTAEQLQAKSVDDKFFSAIQTSKDVDTTLGPTLKGWLEPTTNHCS